MSVYKMFVYHQTQPYRDPRLAQPVHRPDDESVTPKLQTNIEAGSEEHACLKIRKDHPEFSSPSSYAVFAVKVY